jgi:hypothetical protein
VSTFTYRHNVGTYRDREFQLGVRIEPNLNIGDSFAVVLFYEPSEEEYVEIAKIDDSEYEEGIVHFDRYHRAEDAESKDFDIEVDSVFEAEDLLEENWRRYARLYERNHGME